MLDGPYCGGETEFGEIVFAVPGTTSGVPSVIMFPETVSLSLLVIASLTTAPLSVSQQKFDYKFRFLNSINFLM